MSLERSAHAAEPACGAWRGRLALHYRSESGRVVGHDRHDGPLRVLKALYPEGPAICHHVLVHPPGGIVGGDELEIDLRLDAGTHALVTTPGATRFYRSAGAPAAQRATLRVADRARLEWLPLETIAYRGCRALNAVRLDLAPGSETIGWDLLALGLPSAGDDFDHGVFEQRLEQPGVWLERGRIDGAADTRLRDSAVGLGGHGVLATLWFAAGSALDAARASALLDAARETLALQRFATPAGVSAPQSRCIVLRALAHRVEPALAMLVAVRAAWRRVAWQLGAEPPRIWRT